MSSINQENDVATSKAPSTDNNQNISATVTNGMVTYQTSGQPTSSLYVGDLHPDVGEAQIFDKFSPVGTVISIRVCRDMVSRKSLGYAYVNFSVRTEAEKAIEILNFEELKGRQMRIMWSQRDPSLRKSGVGNVFIKNLEKKIQMRELYDTFSAFGDILSCKIATDENGISKGYGFVHFKNQDGADNAIQNIHKMTIYDKIIYVCKFMPRSERITGEMNHPKFNNIFVKNFGEELTDTSFENLFSGFGSIISIKIEKNDEGVSKGFGFVCYRDYDSAIKAVEEMNDKDINGRKIYVSRALKKTERMEQLRKSQEKKKNERANKFAPGVNLFVKNLDDTINDETLRREFSNFGSITSARVMVDSINGRSKGFGFVCFQYAEEATRAVTEMSGKYVGSKPLYVALAQRKEERRAQLAAQYVQRQMNRTAYSSGVGAPNFSGMPNQMFNQQFNNPSLAFALNRPNFMNTVPQMPQQRSRFLQQPGPVPQSMRVGSSNIINAYQPRSIQAIRSMNPSGVIGANMMNLNQNMRPGSQNGMPMNRPGNIYPGNTRIARPQNAAGYGVQQPNFGMTQMRMMQQNVISPEVEDNTPLQNMESIVEDSRNQLGETLFNIVGKITPEYCAKVTGMLLEGDIMDLKTMMEQHMQMPTNSRLTARINKAIQILENVITNGSGANA